MSDQAWGHAFVTQLTEQCDSREEWRKIIEFGREQLLKDRSFLLQLIVQRAVREVVDDGLAGPINRQSVSETVVAIAKELRLSLHSDPPPGITIARGGQ